MHFFYNSPRGLRILQLSTSSHLDQQGVDIPAMNQKEKGKSGEWWCTITETAMLMAAISRNS
jgi:hypothetical protein